MVDIFASFFAVIVIAIIAVHWQNLVLDSESSFLDEVDRREAEIREAELRVSDDVTTQENPAIPKDYV